MIGTSASRTVEPVVLDGRSLTLEAVGRAAAGPVACRIAPAARERMAASRAVIERCASGEEPVYGVNTGFGDLANVRIAPA